MLQIGSKVADFTLLDAFGEKRNFSEFLGKKVVVFFYPKNNTTSCTKELCSFRDVFDEYLEKDVYVIGISKDSVRSHYKVTMEYEIPYTLLSDPNEKVIKLFGANTEKTAKRSIGVSRITFLIDENAIVRHIFDKVSPDIHGEEVLTVIDDIDT